MPPKKAAGSPRFDSGFVAFPMAIEVFHGASIPRELSSAAMEFLWAKWKTLSATNDLTLQRLTEESNHALRDNSSFMMSVGQDPVHMDFVHMYVGQSIQQALGYNPTGQMLSASDSPVAHDLLELYRHSAKHLVPSFVRTTGPRFRSGEIWQGLTLPIKLADGIVILVCYSEQISHHREVYEYLFQSSPEAMLVASPISNDVGDAVDGWVVMVNDAARRLLNFADGIGSLRVRHLAQLTDLDFSFKLHPPVRPGTSVRTVQGQQFEVEIVRFVNVFALLMRPPGTHRPQVLASAPQLAPA
jgi:PAS domain-containing protein